ncbi:MAG: DUF1684 domain-containing protein [Candidatus Krumholzibacteriia bacterium]
MPRHPSLRVPVLVLVCAGCLAGCAGEPEAPGPLAMAPAEHERWEIALVEMRIEKNEAFAQPATTPLAVDRREGFEGLNYYFPEPTLRFRVPLTPAATADTVRLAKGRGEPVPYTVAGTVTFRHEGRNHTLTVYASDGGESLWLPFYDETNRTETYQGGRYLDLDPAADGTVDLDFNYAYNPYCDYDAERWNCTLPPRENTLPFPVAAGEKRFSGDH